MAKGGLIAALDVGSSKICCFIAERHPNREPRVVGIGQQASKGVKNGAIVGMEEAEEAIRNAVHAAEHPNLELRKLWHKITVELAQVNPGLLHRIANQLMLSRSEYPENARVAEQIEDILVELSPA